MRTHGHLGTLAGLLVLMIGCFTKTPPVTLTGDSPEASALSNASAALEALEAEAQDRNLDPTERVQAIDTLGKWATAEVRQPLIDLLKDPVPEIRAAAAKGLGWPGNSSAIPVLSAKVLDKAEPRAGRGAAIGALIKIGDQSVRELVLEASRDPDPEIREGAMRGLVGGPLESPSDRLALATRAAEDGELSLPFRADAVRVLTSTRDPAVVATLVKILETGPRAKIVSPLPNATQQEILAGRYQQIGDVRAWAAQGLGELGQRSVFPHLAKATEDPDDFFLRYVAAGVLVNWREALALPFLLKLLGDPASEVRTVAVLGVGTVADTSNIDVVAACQELRTAYLQEVHPQVRQTLETALATLRCP